MSHAHPRIQKGQRRDRRLSVRGVRRESPDLRKFSRAVIQLAMEQAAAEAAAQAQGEATRPEGSEELHDA